MVSSKVDEPRVEEEKGQGLLNRLHLRLHRDLRRCGEAIKRKASTGVDQLGEERASFEDDGEDDKDNERTTEQRFEVAESYEIRTAAESYEIRTAASKQYGVEVSKKEKWTRGNDSLFIFVVPILIPMVLCRIYISHIVLPVLFVLILYKTLCPVSV